MSSTHRKRFLFVTWEGGGTMPPALAVASRLARLGHDVTMLAEPPSRETIERAGLRYEPFREAPVRASHAPEDDPIRDWEKNPLDAIKSAVDDKFCGPALAYARDVLAALERRTADAIVADAYLLGALLGAERSGLPTAAICADLGLRPVSGRPPPGPGFAPAQSLVARLRDRLVSAMQRRLLARGLRPMNAACAALGLEPVRDVFEPLARVERHLLMTSRAFDYPVEPPHNLRYVGPQLDDPVWGGDWAPPFDRDGRPLVLVSFGSTYQAQADLYRRAVDALAPLPVHALVTLGNVLDPGAIDAPDHVRVVASAPHSAVLEHADVFVTHAGHGSVMRGLAAGVPLVCLPIGRDQRENAARVARLGAGLRLDARTCPRAVGRAIERAAAEPSFRARARSMASELARELEGDPIVGELEALAA